jgi:hypothetical protein
MRGMKQIALRIVLAVLVLAELWLFTGFLPERWQENVYARIEKRWPSQSYDYSRTTHPALDYELQPFKPFGTALLTGLVIINGCIIVTMWVRRDN